MSRPNNWRDKRDEQHFAHNRNAGAGRWWKETRNRKGRRLAKRIDVNRAENYLAMRTIEPKQRKYKYPPIPMPSPTKFTVTDMLPPEQSEKLRELR